MSVNWDADDTRQRTDLKIQRNQRPHGATPTPVLESKPPFRSSKTNRPHYWHPVFAAWRVSRKKVLVRYHPDDLSRVYVSANGKDYLEVHYADLRRPRISLADQREARRLLRAQRNADVCEALIFKTLDQQRELISKAQTRTRAAKRKQGKIGKVLTPKVLRGDGKASAPTDIDYSKPVIPYHAETW